jgi:hypothetical protein
MSKLMLVFGILFLAVGLAVGFLIYFSPGQMQVLALNPDVAAILLVGGALCLGLGGLIEALQESSALDRPDAAAVIPDTVVAPPATPKFTGFGKKASVLTAVVATEVQDAAKQTTAVAKTSVADTISALEQAKSDIAAALGIPPEAGGSAKVEVVEVVEIVEVAEVTETKPAAESEEESEDDELFVVEEKVIKGRPARVLSDGTVEAETDEGWMRFENLEHLDEYLEAMVPEA